jgi:hypothetical protein
VNMSKRTRADTIREPRWRVQVYRSPLGEITHESTFKSSETAEAYYQTVCIPRSVKRLEVREPGANRFTTLRCDMMCVCGGFMQEDAFVHTENCKEGV